MNEKNKIEVIIGGNVYTLVGEESQEYIQKVALYIDKKMNEVKQIESSKKLSTSLISILTSINVADDLFKVKKELQDAYKKIEDLKKQINEKNSQIKDYEKELENMQAENIALREKVDELQLEVMRGKMELDEYIRTFDSKAK
ncbi:cell division protein ZapA [Defluviitalea phaphyphila]|uniref:cell division protein ZapA n=1 Tax=Defluviitalea phaphyphila TaxID=1473580 RepID=UPI00073165B2|nr:cell division protein ZapA [Defluviitalea phaphyphila]